VDILDFLAELAPHFEILDRVITFEKKVEYNKFLQYLALAGFITIIGGFIEFICYRFLGVDTTFFIFGLTGNPQLAPTEEPILFVSLWLLHLIPILAGVIFTIGAPGIISWNKAYRTISIIAVILFISNQLLILLVGISNSGLIPIIWGITLCIGFILAGRILYSAVKIKIIQTETLISGIVSLGLGIISSIVFPLKLKMFFFCTMFGLLLIGMSIIFYLLEDRRATAIQTSV
jgi:hypothetical protein